MLIPKCWSFLGLTLRVLFSPLPSLASVISPRCLAQNTIYALLAPQHDSSQTSFLSSRISPNVLADPKPALTFLPLSLLHIWVALLPPSCQTKLQPLPLPAPPGIHPSPNKPTSRTDLINPQRPLPPKQNHCFYST
jgi:hypothetical protein